MVLVARLSLFHTDYITERFVGLDNYSRLLTDGYFLKSVLNSTWYVLMITPAFVVGGYLIASWLDRMSKRAQSIGRLVFYIPALTAGIIITLVWRWFLQRGGVINWMLGLLGISPVAWLGDVWPARVAIAAIIISTGIGAYVVYFGAGLKSIPAELRDAARIDGASEKQYRRHIVLPLMLPTVLMVMVLSLIAAMQIWETIWGLTGGGPGGLTASPVFDIFKTAFMMGDPGGAAARSVVLLVLIGAVLLIKRRIEKWTEEGRNGVSRSG